MNDVALRGHLAGDRAGGARARAGRPPLHELRPPRSCDRRSRPDRADGLAGQGWRRRAHAREGGRRRRRALRRHRLLEQAGRRASLLRYRSNCCRSDWSRRFACSSRWRCARRRRPRTAACSPTTSARWKTLTELATRLSQTPGVVEHGLFPPHLTSEILVATGSSIRTLRPARSPSRRRRSRRGRRTACASPRAAGRRSRLRRARRSVRRGRR